MIRFKVVLAKEGDKISFAIPKKLIEAVPKLEAIVSEGRAMFTVMGVSFSAKIRRMRIKENVVHRVTVPKRVVNALGLKRGMEVWVEVEPINA